MTHVNRKDAPPPPPPAAKPPPPPPPTAQRRMAREVVQQAIADYKRDPGDGRADRAQSRQTVTQLEQLDRRIEGGLPVPDAMREFRAIVGHDAQAKGHNANARAGTWEGAAKVAEITRNTSVILAGAVAAPIAVTAAGVTGASAIGIGTITAFGTSHTMSRATSTSSLLSAAVQGDDATTRRFLGETLDHQYHLTNGLRGALAGALPLAGNAVGLELVKQGAPRLLSMVVGHTSVQGTAALLESAPGGITRDEVSMAALRALGGVPAGAFTPTTVAGAFAAAAPDVPLNLAETYLRQGGKVDGFDAYAALLSAAVSPAMVGAMYGQRSQSAPPPPVDSAALPGWRPDPLTPGQYRGRGSPSGAIDVAAEPVRAPEVPWPTSPREGAVVRWIAQELRTQVREQQARIALESALPRDFPADSRAEFGRQVQALLPNLPLAGPHRMRAAAELWQQVHHGRPADARVLEGPLGAVLGKLDMQATNAAIASELAMVRNLHGVPDARLGPVAKQLFDQHIDAQNAALQQRPAGEGVPLWKLNQLLLLNAQAIAVEHARTPADLESALSFRGQWGQIGHLQTSFDGEGRVRVDGFGLERAQRREGPLGWLLDRMGVPPRIEQLEPRVFFGTGAHGDTYVPGGREVDAARLGEALLAGDRRAAQAILRPLVTANLDAFLRADAGTPRMHAAAVDQPLVVTRHSAHAELNDFMRREWDTFRGQVGGELPASFPRAKVDALVALLAKVEMTEHPTGARPPNGGGRGAPEPWFAPQSGKVGVPDSFLQLFARNLEPRESSLFPVLLAMHESWHQVGSGMHAGNIAAVGRSGPVLMKMEYRADQLSNLAAVLFEQQRSKAPDSELGRIAYGVLDIGARLTIAFDLQARGLSAPAPEASMADRRLSRFLTTSMLMVMSEQVRSKDDLFSMYGGDTMWAEVVGTRKGNDRGDPTTTGPGENMRLVFEVGGRPVVYDQDNARIGRIVEALMSYQFTQAADELRPIMQQHRRDFMPWTDEGSR